MRRALRVMGWLVVLVAAAIVAYGVGLKLHPAPPLAGQALHDPPDAAAVTLVDGEGRPVRLSRFRGDVLLVTFGFSRCANACVVAMRELAKAYREVGSPQDLKVIMVTVDPRHDTPTVLSRWVRSFDPNFIGLTGSTAQIAAAARTFMVGYDPGGPPVDRSPVVEVVGRRSHIRYVYDQTSMLWLGRDLPRLLGRTL